MNLIGYPAFLASALMMLSAHICFSKDLSLDPSNWESESKVKLSKSSDGLTVKSLSTSIWILQKQENDFEDDDSIAIEYDLRGGNLIIQANWFDSAGDFIESTTLGRTNSDEKKALYPLVSQRGGNISYARYMLKIWVEADMPSLTIQSLGIVKNVDDSLLVSANDFEKNDEVSVEAIKSGAIKIEKLGSGEVVSVLTEKRLEIREVPKITAEVEDISPSTAFSLQLIFWSNSGAFLGHADILKDITNSKSERIDVTSLGIPEGADAYSLKCWLSGAMGSSVLLRISLN